MLAEAIEVIRKLHEGDLVTHRGEFFDVDTARESGTCRSSGVPIATAVSGEARHRALRAARATT